MRSPPTEASASTSSEVASSIRSSSSQQTLSAAPPFLSALSPRKSAPLTGTTKGVVTIGQQSSESRDEGRDAESSTQDPPSKALIGDNDDDSDEDESASITNPTRPDQLSRRIGSAMNSLVISGDGEDETTTVTDTDHDTDGEDEQGQRSRNIIVAKSGRQSDIEQQPEAAASSSPPPSTPSAFWSTWTSKAASGSLNVLKQGGSVAAAGWESAVRVNPFRLPGGGSALENGKVQDPSASTADSSQTATSSKGAPPAAAPPDSDEEDAHLIRSAAASLRKGAKDEAKRRRAKEQTETESKRRAVQQAAASKDKGKGEVDDNLRASTSRTASSSSVPTASQNIPKNFNVFDYQGTLPGSSAPPSGEQLPERRYFVLTQAGKPVFLSHLAARRLAREEAARARLKSLREGKRRRQEWREQAVTASAEVKKALEEEEKRAAQAEEEARQKDALESDRDEEDSAVQVGVLQALVSNYSSQGNDTLERKSIEILDLPRDTSRVVYLLKEPLYLAVTSTWHDGGEIYADSTSLLKAQLEILHAGLISLISESQLQRLFARGFNFDLRRMLEGTDGILSALVARFQDDFGLLLGAGGGGVCLRPTRMDLKLREDLGSCLGLERWDRRPLADGSSTLDSLSSSSPDELKPPPPRPRDLLYVLLVSSDGQLITMLRPRRLSAYPLDLHLLLNTINGMSRKSARESGTVNWIPICLPRFAPQGMVQAHVSWLDAGAGDPTSSSTKRTAECALVIVTADRESFEEISKWRDGVVQALTVAPSPLRALSQQLQTSSISPDILHLPGLRHFVLKKKDDLQIISSEWVGGGEGEEQDGEETSFETQLARERIRRCYARGRELSVLALRKRKKSQGKGKGSSGVAHDPKESSARTTSTPVELTLRPGVYTHYFQTPFECIYVECPPSSASAASKTSASAAASRSDTTTASTSLGSTISGFVTGGSGGSTMMTTTTAVGPYELYLTLSPHVPPATARKIAREVLRWGLGLGPEGRERWRIWMGRGSVF